jgi:formate hydrogenlyase transcriptional activator
MNCATIPSTLLESEMFGHEKGAYTGAAACRIGRLEQADGGTLFLDEIGEMPLDLQPKLLRAVQDQRFERLGSGAAVQVNVRFVWATNRDLRKMVTDKQFRSDLYYRLNVFPIALPALRDRVEDIPALVHHFLREFNRRMSKNITHIPLATMERLMRREWPGNVRELRNVIERATILSPGATLQIPAKDISGTIALAENSAIDAAQDSAGWDEIERQYLLRVLRETGGVVAWAASRLHLKRTTLDSRLRRLSITLENLRALRNR